MSSMEIIVGSDKDGKELGQLLFEFNKSIAPGLSKPKSDDVIRYIIKHQDKMIAGIIGQIKFDKILYVDIIFVETSFRKRGYASSLLDKLETNARSKGCYMSILDTMNVEAVCFYEKHGYKIFGTLDNFPCPGISYFSMRKDI